MRGSTVSDYLIQNYKNCLKINAFRFDKYRQNLVDYYASLSDNEKQLYHLIYNHNSELLLPHALSNSIKIVVLRSPIERAMSSYYYGVSRDLISPCSKGICEFIVKQPNIYVDRFSTKEERSELRGSDLVAKCYFNMRKRYDLIGITEEMGSFLDELQKIAELPIPYTGRRRNVTVNRKKAKDIDPNVMELAMEALAPDFELYGLIKRDFKNSVGI